MIPSSHSAVVKALDLTSWPYFTAGYVDPIYGTPPASIYRPARWMPQHYSVLYGDICSCRSTGPEVPQDLHYALFSHNATPNG